MATGNNELKIMMQAMEKQAQLRNGKLIVILVCIVPKFVLFQKLAHNPAI